jgi:hypothetical protein
VPPSRSEPSCGIFILFWAFSSVKWHGIRRQYESYAIMYAELRLSQAEVYRLALL